MPDSVTCRVCGEPWHPADPGVGYRSLDHQWWCADETACTERASRREIMAAAGVRSDPATLAAMYRALDESWNRLWAEMGWDR